ncbi:mucin-5AC-like isoform X2 [Aquarana catesbeiana]|uniref:mucin-5AC-like isoform X2 n=1 Tax=Aquarana catesbeiana TaxID=8400 RepID=UPI003CCA59BC
MVLSGLAKLWLLMLAFTFLNSIGPVMSGNKKEKPVIKQKISPVGVGSKYRGPVMSVHKKEKTVVKQKISPVGVGINYRGAFKSKPKPAPANKQIKPNGPGSSWNHPKFPADKNDKGHFGSVTMMPKPTPIPQFTSHSEQVCSTWGNYHFMTYDGDFYYYPGKCKYVFASHCKGSQEDFNILFQRTEEEFGPVIRYISIKIHEVVIEISTNSITMDGELVTETPVDESGVLIDRIGDYVKIAYSSDIYFMWNGEDSILLKLNRNKYANQTCGMCGDFNGVRGLTYDGIEATVVQYGNMQKRNGPVEDCPDVSPLTSTKCKNMDKICENNLTSEAFRSCNKLLDPKEYIASCVQDLCRCSSNNQMSCLCNMLAEYSRQCTHAGGVPGNWRNPKFCSKTCPLNMVRQECGSPCLNTCSNTDRSMVCEDHNIDGCFCPKDTVLDDINNTGCIPQENCFCVYDGKNYSPGSSYSNPCRACTCSRGKWNCKELPCKGTCSVVGGSHITTFDGFHYTTNGDCSYVLAKHSTGHDFVLLGELRRCGIIKSKSCLRGVVLVLNGGETVVNIKENCAAYLNWMTIQLPVSVANLTISQPTSFYLNIKTVGMSVMVQCVPVMQVYVDLDSSYEHQTCGLCGNYNKIQSDDFKALSGVIEGTAAAFVNTWKTLATCPNIKNSYEDPCSLSVEKEKYAMHWCGLLTSETGPFTECHSLESPLTYHANCMSDTCSCTDSEECMCAALSSYAFACTKKGVLITDWRDNVCQNYTQSCKASQIFRYHVNELQPTCRSLSEADATRYTELDPVDGCVCRDGTYMNDNGDCVEASSCPCYYQGNVMQSGEMIEENGVACTCDKGQLNCMGEVKKPVCILPLSYLNCTRGSKGVECQKSCDTLDMDCYSSQCISGCVCPKGLVFDGLGNCIPEEQCSCIHNEAAYSPGTTISVACNTCTCKNRKWQCTHEQCLGSCSVYGDGHHISFDNKHFTFSGACEYTLVQDHCGEEGGQSSFRVIMQNVQCGYNGTICTKSIKIFFGGEELYFDEEKIEIVKRGEANSIQYELIRKGMYLILKSVNGLFIIWDTKATVHVKLSSDFKRKVCGICGNYDGNANNDFTTRSHSVVENLMEFYNSWKIDPKCPDVHHVKNPCSINPYRKAWATKQCAIITSHVFQPCHSQVDPTIYYDSCISDSCSCVSGGDCECFCTAVAAYAQACSENGVCIRWRTPTICPMFCDYYNDAGECAWHYKPCGDKCMKTCRNPKGECLYELSGLEGCYPSCPASSPYLDEDNMKCVSQCGCNDENGNFYNYGENVPTKENCHSCECSTKGISCQYDVSACRCEHEGKMYHISENISSFSDKDGSCKQMKCDVNGTIVTLSNLCSTTGKSAGLDEPNTTKPPCSPQCRWTQWYNETNLLENEKSDSENYDTITTNRKLICKDEFYAHKIECRLADSSSDLPNSMQRLHSICNVINRSECIDSIQDGPMKSCRNLEMRFLCCDDFSLCLADFPTTKSTSFLSTKVTSGPGKQTPVKSTGISNFPSLSTVPTPRSKITFSTSTTTQTVFSNPTFTSVTTTTASSPSKSTLESTAANTSTTSSVIQPTLYVPPETTSSHTESSVSTTTMPTSTFFSPTTPLSSTTTATSPSKSTSESTAANPSSTSSVTQSTFYVPPETTSRQSESSISSTKIPTSFISPTTKISPTATSVKQPISSTTTFFISTSKPSTHSSPVPASTKPTTSIGSTTTHCYYCFWTKWYNENYPTSKTESGDQESYEIVKSKGYSECRDKSHVQDIQCEASSYPEMAFKDLKQNATCSIKSGLICRNKDNLGPFNTCLDYKVRFYCCEKQNCPSSTTTTATSPSKSTSESTTAIPSSTSSVTQSTPYVYTETISIGSKNSVSTTTIPTSVSFSPTTKISPTATSVKLTTSSTTTAFVSSTTPNTPSNLPTVPTKPTTSSPSPTSTGPTTTSCYYCFWTKWHNENYPTSKAESGDQESYEIVKSKGYSECRDKSHVQDIQCEASSYPGMAFKDLKQNATCSVKSGLICRNKDNLGPFNTCLDYKVRFYCCEKQNCPSSTTTTATSPSKSTSESTTAIPSSTSSVTQSTPYVSTETTSIGSKNSVSTTTIPTSVSFSPTTKIPPTATSVKLTTSSTTTAFVSSTTPNTPFSLPTVPTKPTTSSPSPTSTGPTTTSCYYCFWTKWYNENYPTSKAESGDQESYEIVKSKGYSECRDKSHVQDIQCEASSYPEMAFKDLKQNATCSVKSGLICRNKDNLGPFNTCLDYKVRFYCCEKQNCPSSTTTTATSPSKSTSESTTAIPSSTSSVTQSTPYVYTETISIGSKNSVSTTTIPTSVSFSPTTKISPTATSVKLTTSSTTTAFVSSTTPNTPSNLPTVPTKPTTSSPSPTSTGPTTTSCYYCFWTKWHNENYPTSKAESGDQENYEIVKSKGYSECRDKSHVQDIQCEASSYPEMAFKDLKQNATCSVKSGLICRNKDNLGPFNTCLDYKVRFYCCEKQNCPSSTTTTATSPSKSTSESTTAIPSSTSSVTQSTPYVYTETISIGSKNSVSTTTIPTSVSFSPTTKISPTATSVKLTTSSTTTAFVSSTTPNTPSNLPTVPTKPTTSSPSPTSTGPTTTSCYYCFWTKWHNENYPTSKAESGDQESYEIVKSKGYSECRDKSHVQDIQCEASSYPGMAFKDLKQNATCSVKSGLICRNKDNLGPFNTCLDYKVRFYCCEKQNCPSSTTTTATSPSKSTSESTTAIPSSTSSLTQSTPYVSTETTSIGSKNSVSTTTIPTSVSFSPTTKIPPTATSVKLTTSSTTTAFVSSTTPNTPFSLPTVPTKPTTSSPSPTSTGPTTTSCYYCFWTKWYNENYPTSKAESGDQESYEIVKSKGYSECRDKSHVQDIQCEASSYSGRAFKDLKQNATCSVKSGLICRNKDNPGQINMCLDYKVRFYCCEKQNCPSSTTTTATSPSKSTSESTTAIPSSTSSVTQSTPYVSTETTSIGSKSSVSTTTIPTSVSFSPTTKISPTATSVKLTTSSTTTAFVSSSTPNTPSSLPTVPTKPTTSSPSPTSTGPTTTSCYYCFWTKWYNENYPTSKAESGDQENYEIVKSKGYSECRDKSHVQDIQCEASSYSGRAFKDLKQNATCSVKSGLICRNKDNPGQFNMCLDYKVRFYCCEKQNCPSSTTTTATSPSKSTSESTTAIPSSTSSVTQFALYVSTETTSIGSKSSVSTITIPTSTSFSPTTKFSPTATSVKLTTSSTSTALVSSTTPNTPSSLPTKPTTSSPSPMTTIPTSTSSTTKISPISTTASPAKPNTLSSPLTTLSVFPSISTSLITSVSLSSSVKPPTFFSSLTTTTTSGKSTVTKPHDCVYGGSLYTVGSSIPQPYGSCQKCKCSATMKNYAEIICKPIMCNTDCQLGYTYKKVEGQCCGKCVQEFCVLNNTVQIKPGSFWNPPGDNCTSYDCERDTFMVVKKVMSCPRQKPLDCDKGILVNFTSSDGCCTIQFCEPRKCDVMKSWKLIESGGCEANVTLTNCGGYCSSVSRHPNFPKMQKHDCTCCQATKTMPMNIQLECNNGRKIGYTYTDVLKCSCRNAACVFTE